MDKTKDDKRATQARPVWRKWGREGEMGRRGRGSDWEKGSWGRGVLYVDGARDWVAVTRRRRGVGPASVGTGRSGGRRGCAHTGSRVPELGSFITFLILHPRCHIFCESVSSASDVSPPVCLPL